MLAWLSRRRPQARDTEHALITHTGGCHCRRVRFEVLAPAKLQVLECNCSICSTTAFLHLVVPAHRFKLLSGGEVLTSYTFNTRTAQHFFCSVCGVKSFYVPRGDLWSRSVNVRCLDPGTVQEVVVSPFNGLRWGSAFGLVPGAGFPI
jgi:hypothetical protein